MKVKKICFVTVDCSPEYLGGYSLYHKNLIEYAKREKNLELSWVYFGKKDKSYFRDGVNYFEIRTNRLKSLTWIWESFALSKFFKKHYFEIINSTVGLDDFFYKKRKDQKIIQTFHGTAYYFNLNHFKRFNFFKKFLFSPLLLISWIQEKPHKETDKLICVSEKVKKQVKNLYGFGKNIKVIRTGVDLKKFRGRNKEKTRIKLDLNQKNIYGLYVGRGGYWTKGLDRVIKLSKELYKLDQKYKLILIGPDPNKVKNLLTEPFIILKNSISREKMPFYYNSVDFLFCMSRYEGGAPTMIVSEAMASKGLVICSKSSEQEIIKDSENGLIITGDYKKEAKRIIKILRNKKLRDKIIKNSFETINKISLKSWGSKYLNVLTN